MWDSLIVFMQENFDFNVDEDITDKEELAEIEEIINYIKTRKSKDIRFLKEKIAIQKASKTAGWAILVLLLVSFLISLVYSFFTITNNLTLNKIINNSATTTALQVLISVVCFGVLFSIVYKLNGYRISDLVSFKKTNKNLALPTFFFGVAFCAFSNITASIMSSFFSSFGIDYSMPETQLPQGFFGFMLTFLGTAVVPAFVEEFAFRGLILGTLKKYGNGFAIITSSILFGLIHGNFGQIPFAFSVGLFLGYSTVITGSLRVAIGVHFFNNFISVFFNYFLNNISLETENLIYTVFLLLSLVLGILFVKSDGENAKLFKFERKETKTSEIKKYKMFFLRPLIIIVITMCLIEALGLIFV